MAAAKPFKNSLACEITKLSIDSILTDVHVCRIDAFNTKFQQCHTRVHMPFCSQIIVHTVHVKGN